jgi:hypothetical protein
MSWLTWMASIDGSGSPSRALLSGLAPVVDAPAFDCPEPPTWTSVGGPAPIMADVQSTPLRAPSPPSSLMFARIRAMPPSLCTTIAGELELSSLVVGLSIVVDVDQPLAGPPLE